MAIDSAEKRKSASSVAFHILASVTPNASKDVQWRQQSGWSYSGIAPDAPAPPSEAKKYRGLLARPGRMMTIR